MPMLKSFSKTQIKALLNAIKNVQRIQDDAPFQTEHKIIMNRGLKAFKEHFAEMALTAFDLDAIKEEEVITIGKLRFFLAQAKTYYDASNKQDSKCIIM